MVASRWLIDFRRLFRRRQLRRLRFLGGRLGGGRFLLAFLEDERVALAGDLAQPVHHGAGSRRDQAADDDVLLEAFERVDLAVDRGLGEHPRGLLERRRRDERAGLQRGLGDAEQDRVADRLLLAFGPHLHVDLVHLDLVDLLALDQVGFTGVVDFDLLQHLADDHLDVLVVDRHALQPIDVLDLVDQVTGELLDALDRQDVVRRRVAFDDEVALLDHVAVLQVDVLALRDQIFLGLLVLTRIDDDAPLVLVVLAEADRAGDFRDDRGLLRPARLEQLRYPRQTAGDVAGLGALGRDTGDDVARLHIRTRVDRNDGVDGELVARLAAAGDFQHLVVLVLDHDRRTQVDAAAGAPVGDHALGDASRLVERLRHRLALDQVLEADRALDLGEDRPRVGVPLGDALTAPDLVAVVDQQPRTVLDAVHGPLGPVGIEHRDHHVADHRHVLPVGVLHDVLVLDLDLAVEVRLDERLLRDLGGAADVERAHGELGARLADRLRGDDAHRLAHIDRRAAGEIAPVALGAHARGGLAGEHRADAQFLHARGDDRLDLRLLQQGALLDDHLVRGRIAHVLGRGAAEDTAGERSHDLAGIDDGARLDAGRSAAVLGGDDAVLRHIDQPAGEIARVGGLERGVGEAFAGAVGRVEVLELRQPFLEVTDDRAFDDLARGLRHQAAHAGELTHLRGRAARAGMRHHVDRVDLRLAAALDPLHRRDLVHHFCGDLLGALRPRIDHLVVLLDLGDQTVVVLLLELLGERAGLLDDLPLRAGYDHVVLAERNAVLEGVVESKRHYPVAEEYRLFLPAVAIDLIDHAGDFPLGHQLVDDVVGNLRALRQHLTGHHPAVRRVEPLTHRLALLVQPDPAIFDFGVEVDDLLVQGVLDLSHVAEHLRVLLARVLAHDREIIEAEHDILRRHDDRRAVGRMQDVVRAHHQHARLELRFERQRHMHGHLVAVEVGVEGRAHQRMQLDRLALDQHRLERLDV